MSAISRSTDSARGGTLLTVTGFPVTVSPVTSAPSSPRPGSVVVERSPGMREVGGSIPGRVKQKTLKFEVLLLCLASA